MNVLLFCNGYPSPERKYKCIYNKRLCDGLRALGCKITIWTVRSWKPGRPRYIDYEYEGLSVRCWFVPQLPAALNRTCKRGFGLVALANAWVATQMLYRPLLEKSKELEVMHAVSAFTPAHVCAKVAQVSKVPLVIQLIGSDVEYGLRDLQDVQYSRSWLSGVSAVLANSNSLLRQFDLYAPHISANRYVRYRGVDLDEFRSEDRASESWKGRILYLGGLSRMASGTADDDVKGGKFLLQTWARFEQKLVAAGLRLTFGGPDISAMQGENYIRRLMFPDHVQIGETMATRSVASEMRAHDILVIPSLSEGLPNVLLEGMASGLAIVTTGVGGISEAAGPLQEALYFSPGRSEQLVSQLCELARNPSLRLCLGRNARKRVVGKFDSKNYGNSVRQIYSEMLDGVVL